MDGFTYTLTGLAFDAVIPKTTAALKAEGFGIRKADVRAVADAAEQRLRRACESLGGSDTQAT